MIYLFKSLNNWDCFVNQTIHWQTGRQIQTESWIQRQNAEENAQSATTERCWEQQLFWKWRSSLCIDQKYNNSLSYLIGSFTFFTESNYKTMWSKVTYSVVLRLPQCYGNCWGDKRWSDGFSHCTHTIFKMTQLDITVIWSEDSVEACRSDVNCWLQMLSIISHNCRILTFIHWYSVVINGLKMDKKQRDALFQ